MYQLLVFIHVTSALFLGSFLVLPWVIKAMLSRTSGELIGFLKMASSFLRSGHYALIVLIITGGWMVVGYSAFPSILWVTTAVMILLLIGAMMGMIHKTLKKMIISGHQQNKLVTNTAKLKTLSWVTFSAILIVILIMTNPYLLA